MTRYVKKGEKVPWYKGLAARIILPAIVGTAMFSNTNKIPMPKYFHTPNEQKQVGYMAAKPATELEKRIVYPEQNKPTQKLENIINNPNKNNKDKDNVKITIWDKKLYNNVTRYEPILISVSNSQFLLHTSKGTIKTDILKEKFSNIKYARDTLEEIMAVESSGDPNAENPYGAYGLFQITKYALADYNQFVDQYHPELINKLTGERIKLQKYTLKDMKDPEKNIRVAVIYWHILGERYDWNEELMKKVYSGDVGNPSGAEDYRERMKKAGRIFKIIRNVEGAPKGIPPTYNYQD